MGCERTTISVAAPGASHPNTSPTAAEELDAVSPEGRLPAAAPPEVREGLALLSFWYLPLLLELREGGWRAAWRGSEGGGSPVGVVMGWEGFPLGFMLGGLLEVSRYAADFSQIGRWSKLQRERRRGWTGS